MYIFFLKVTKSLSSYGEVNPILLNSRLCKFYSLLLHIIIGIAERFKEYPYMLFALSILCNSENIRMKTITAYIEFN